MERQQILDLYEWSPGTCFRHPSKGEVSTTVIAILEPPRNGKRPVRACADCVIALEDMRREAAARTGRKYEPGRVGEPTG